MKREPSPDIRFARREWVRRVDRFAADLNIVLMIFAMFYVRTLSREKI